MANSHNTVAHNWAHQTGKSQRGFNLFYDGNTIFSHGRHFPIARIYRDVAINGGQRCILFTTQRRSVSTARHKTIVWRAIHGDTVFDVDNVSAEGAEAHSANYAAMITDIAELVAKAKRARLYGASYLESATDKLAKANAYADWFNISVTRVTDLAQIDSAIAEIARKAQESATLAEQQRAIQARQAKLANRERLKQWLHGAAVYPPHTKRPMLRVNGDTVETTWGAKVPLHDAIRVYHTARDCRPEVGAFKPVPAVGDFGEAMIDHGGNIRIGCHRIPFRYACIAANLAGIA